MEKIISICIPTYNGSKTIEETLNSIIQSIEKESKFSEKVEIVLTDDCSIDNTSLIIKKYSNKYDYVKVFLNKENLGMDANFKQVALNANGKYIWYCGQDDIFLTDAVGHILNAIITNPDLGIISVNYSQYSEKNKKYICKSMFKLQSFFPKEINEDKDMLFNNSKDFFYFFNDVPSFLPATIMKKDYWITTENDKYLGTHFIQYATVLLNINKAKILAVTKPLIKGLIPSIGWQTNGDKLFTIQLGKIKAATLVFEDINNSLPEKIFLGQKRAYFRNFTKIVMASSFYKFDLSENNKKDLKLIYGKTKYYLYFYPILLSVSMFPKFLLKFMFIIKSYIKDKSYAK